ncbi:MAG TPA: hypothetical protein VHR47_03775, partial [Bacillota bacterium]|nr:hypothetical protein [Bacillota bacterium]
MAHRFEQECQIDIYECAGAVLGGGERGAQAYFIYAAHRSDPTTKRNDFCCASFSRFVECEVY